MANNSGLYPETSSYWDQEHERAVKNRQKELEMARYMEQKEMYIRTANYNNQARPPVEPKPAPSNRRKQLLLML